jgi:L-ascorbate metabolism protein UlaG (beta-lactamase superfamily)
MGFSVQFHEVACFSVHCDEIIVVFDPHNGESMHLPPPSVRNADIVLCTHKHYDHNNGVEIVKSPNAFVLEEKPGDFEFRGVKIHGTKVRHGGDPQWGLNIVYSVRFPSGKIFIHGGDIGQIPTLHELEEILTFGQPDIVILPIGGYYCLDAKQALTSAKLLRAKKTTIVCHYLYGPLLTKEDFQGMTTESPFLELAKGKIQEIDGILDSNLEYADYVYFRPHV